MQMSTAVAEKGGSDSPLGATAAVGGGGGPDPEDPNEKEKKELNLKVDDTTNMAVSQEAIHDITQSARS